MIYLYSIILTCFRISVATSISSCSDITYTVDLSIYIDKCLEIRELHYMRLYRITAVWRSRQTLSLVSKWVLLNKMWY
jgi:hypothetical protein